MCIYIYICTHVYIHGKYCTPCHAGLQLKYPNRLLQTLGSRTLTPRILRSAAKALHTEALHPKAPHPKALHPEALHPKAIHPEALHPKARTWVNA